jgi:trk system potassium uptake protein TrkA
MYAIIIGGGKVGYYLAKELIDGNNEVLIIEKDGAKGDRISGELGDVVLKGDGCEATTMEAAGFGRADMVIAVTGDDEDNLVACQVAKVKFDVPRTIARINNPKNEAIFRKLGIDTTVSATAAILLQIEQELPEHPLMPLMKFKGDLEIVDVRVPPTAAVVGKRVRELLLPQQSIIVLLVDQGGNPRVPTSDTVILAEDEVVAVTRTENEDALRAVLTSPSRAEGSGFSGPGYGPMRPGPYDPIRGS